MHKAKRLIYYWLPLFLWMGLIYFLSSFHKLQASPVGWQDFVLRKSAHFLEYTILFLLYYRGFNNTTLLPFRKKLILTLFLTIGYALTDEFHQTKVNGRTGRPFDIGIDSLGAIAGLFFVVKLIKFLPDKLQKIII